MLHVKQRFLRWLKANHYEAASELYPGAVHASELVEDFIASYPSYEGSRDLLSTHAKVVGWVSDYSPQVDPEDLIDDEADDEWD
jgi:hypothetical protein